VNHDAQNDSQKNNRLGTQEDDFSFETRIDVYSNVPRGVGAKYRNKTVEEY